MSPLIPRAALWCLAALFSLALPVAALSVSGSITSDTTWAVGDSPIIVTGNLSLNNGALLTVDPGVVVKFQSGVSFTISNGSVSALGTAGEPIYFTSINDDAAGGAAPGSTGAPASGDWGGIQLSVYNAAFDHVKLRYGGGFYGALVSVVNGGALTLTNGEVGFSSGDGIQSDNISTLAVSSTAFTGNATWAVNADGTVSVLSVNAFNAGSKGVRLSMAQTVQADGNVFEDVGSPAMQIHPGVTLQDFENTIVVRSSTAPYMAISFLGGTVSRPTTWVGSALPFIVDDTPSFTAAAPLTITPGAVVKFANAYLSLAGSLTALGTVSKPIILTSYKDDSVGGDTNNDADATSPAPGDWGAIFLNASSATLDNAALRYGGANFGAMVSVVNGGSAAMTNGVLEFSIGDGIQGDSISPLSVSSTVFNANAGWGVNADGLVATLVGNAFRGDAKGVRLSLAQTVQADDNTFQDVGSPALQIHPAVTLQGFENTVVVRSSTAPYMAIKFLGGTVSRPTTWVGNPLPYIVEVTPSFDSSGPLTITPGAVIKLADAYLSLPGGLTAIGTAAQPIIFTSYKDDSAGGDTNGDGSATAPAPGDWQAVQINIIGASLANAKFRYGGSGFGTMLSIINGAAVSLDHGEILDSSGDGIQCDNLSSLAVSSTSIQNNAHGIASASGEATSVHNCAITGNSVAGVSNTGTTALQAQYNWWGSSTGPTNAANPEGTGDAVVGNADFVPFLESFGQQLPPQVFSVALLNPNPTRSKTVQFQVAFSNTMNTSVAPVVTYGQAPPYDSYTAGPGNFTSPTVWTASAAIPSGAVDGSYSLLVSSATDQNGLVMSASTHAFYSVDNTPPEVSISSPAPGVSLSRPFTVFAGASDSHGIAQVAFAVDGVVLATATEPAYSFLWDTRDFADGAHDLTALAYDTVGNVGVATVTVILSYAPPAAPVIQVPVDGVVVNLATITVSGTAPTGTTVQLQVNGEDAATAQVDSGGHWTTSVFFASDIDATLTAVSFEPRGFSSPSAPVRVSFTTHAPDAPVAVSATVIAGGRADIKWQAAPGKTPAYYRVYRSTDDLDLIPGDSAPGEAFLVGTNVTGTEVVDAPPYDDLYFYAVTALDGANNESPLSQAPYAFVDRFPPTGSVALTTAAALGPGQYPITLTVSEVLSQPPLLIFAPYQNGPVGAGPRAVSLSGTTPTLWVGTLTVTSDMLSGTAQFGLEAHDLSGNVGTTIVAGSTIALVTLGPAGQISLSRPAPVNAGALGVTLTLTAPVPSAPALSFTPSGGSPQAVSLSPSGAQDGREWSGTVTITGATGDGDAAFAFSATDAYGNTGTALSGGASSFLIDTSAPGAPLLPHANPGPGGAISLNWSGPSGEHPSAYAVFRDAVQIATVTPVADFSGSYADTAANGSHLYAIESLDAAGNVSSAASVSATADSIAPSAPQNLALTVNGFGQFQLTWDAVGDAASYRLYQATFTISSTAGLASRLAVSPFIDAPAANGTYFYAVTARDAAGNESLGSNQVSQNYTQGAPVVEITGAAGGQITNQNLLIAYTATDGNQAPSSVVATLDGQPFVSGTTVTAEGDHAVQVVATNLANHTSTATTNFTIDKTSPVLTASVNDGATISGSTSVSVAATDLHPSTSNFLLINDLLGMSVTYASGAPITRNGDYRLVMNATDAAGNAAARTISFHVDAYPGAPLNLSVNLADTAMLSWTSPGSDATAYRVYRDGQRISASLLAATSFEDVNYTPGAHVYEVSAVDGHGSEGARVRAAVPAVALSLSAPTLARGYFDTLTVLAQNQSTQSFTAGPALVEILSNGIVVTSASASAVSAPAGQTASLPAVIATPPTLPGQAAARVTVVLPTDPGSHLSIARAFPLTATDPAQPLVEALPDVLLAGGYSAVRVRLYNRGSAPLDVRTAVLQNSTSTAVNDVTVRLKTANGTLLASAGINQANGAAVTLVGGQQIYFVTVPAGGSLLTDPVQIAVPASAPASLSVEAEISTPTYDLGFARLPGTRGFLSSMTQAVATQLPYRATVTPLSGYYDQGSSVTLTGSAFDSEGQPVTGVPVTVRILSNGFDRRLTAYSDSSGTFTTVFDPLPNEAGVYAVSAFYPQAVAGSAQSTFTIVGFAFNYRDFSVSMAQNSSYHFDAYLSNSGASPLTGLVFSSAPVAEAGLSVAFDNLPTTLAAGEQTRIGVMVTASPTAASTGTVNVIVADSHGYSRTMPVSATVSPAVVLPAASPQQFQLGLLGGEMRIQTITLQNKGFETWRDVTLTTPTVPFVTLQGTSSLGDIPPNGTASFSLLIQPSPSQPNQTYDGNPLLQVLSANAPVLPILGSIAVTSVRQGDAVFSVINADKPRNAQGQGVGIDGAAVTLISLDVSGLTFKATADANGTALLNAVPSGNYAWRAEAAGFQAKSGTVVIEPGLQNLVEAILVTSIVTYEWKVTPTTIQDKYNITLDAVFKTDVPAPILVTEPSLIDLNMVGGQTAYSQFTITNRGVIKATDVKVRFSGSEAVQITLPFDSIPEILPGQTVAVPMKVFLVHASCEGKTATTNGTGTCAEGHAQERDYAGFQLTAGHNDNGGSCAGGGGTGTVGQDTGGGSVAYVGTAKAVAAQGNASSGSACAAAGPTPKHGRNSKTMGSADKRVSDKGAAKQDDSGPCPKPGSPGMGWPSTYTSDNPVDGPNGYGWYTPSGWSIQVQPDGSWVATDPDGNQTVYVALGDILQPLNGSGPEFALPVHVGSELGVGGGAPGSAAAQVACGFVTTTSGLFVEGTANCTIGANCPATYHGLPVDSPPIVVNGPSSCPAVKNTLLICPGSEARLSSCDPSVRIPAVVHMTDRDGNTSYFAYYNPAQKYLLVDFIDKNQNFVNYLRDEDGNITRTVDRHDRYVDLTNDANGHVTGYHDWGGRSAAFTYDANGNRLTSTDPNGDVTHYAYDSNHRMTQITYPNGGHTYYTYNSTGTVSEVSDDGGVNKMDFDYQTTSTTVATDALGHSSVYDYITVGGLRELSKVRDPQGNETSFEYDSDLNLSKVVDPLGRVTQIATTRAGLFNGASSVGGVNSAVIIGNVNTTIRTTDPLGNDHLVEMDGDTNFPLSATDPKSNRTSFAYDGNHDLLQITDPLNNTTRMTYDDFGHVATVKDALNHVSAFTYNGNGALVTATDPLGRTVNMTRDPLSRATEIFDPAGNKTQVTYDIADNVTQVKDALNGATGVAYQLGREGRLPTTVTDAKNHATGVSYDVQGRVTSVTNALNQSASISYDAMSRPSQVTTRNGQTIGFAYDTLNRLTQLSLPEGAMNLGYDAAGRLLTASHYNGSSLALAYNPVNWVTQVVQTLPNGFSATLGYSYDANGNRTGMTTPWGNFSYAYDAMDRVTSIRNAFSQTISFIYDALGRRTKMSYPNGTEADYAYDAAGQISQVLHQKTADQTAIAFTNYAYDAAGNRTGMTDMTGAHAYGYDALNRLTSASHPGMSSLPVKAETFDYDAIGNRTADALRTGYAYDAANRIVSDSSFTYTSNADGNILTRTSRATGETLTFVYNSGNQLIQVNGPSGTLATYKYDIAGNRVEKNVGGTITRFVYDGKNILAILDADNNLLALFTHGPGIDSPLIMRKNGADYFYHADALGNVTALTDSAGATIETYEYEAFGKTVVKDAQGGLHDTSTVGNPFMYTSREFDAESGLYYLRARYLDADTGRFLQEDPLASINLYLYAANNPIDLRDPLGLCPNIFSQLGDATLNTIGGLGNGLSLGGIGSQNGFYDTNSLAYRAGNIVGYGITGGIITSSVGSAYLAYAAASASVIAEGTQVYRVWGGDSGANGRSWTTIDPGTVANYRDFAGLPVENSGRFVSTGILINNSGVVQKYASPLAGNSGGILEYVIPNPGLQVQLTNVQGANPHF